MKVPEPRKLKSGNWFIQLRLDGESISVTRETRAECLAEAQLIKAEHAAGRRQVAHRKTREKTLSEIVLAYIEANRAVLSPSTIRGYEDIERLRFKAYRQKPLQEIDFQRMINAELDLASPKTVKNAWGVVRSSLIHAGYPLPQVKLAAVPVNEIAFLQPEEVLLFCESLKGHSYEIPALILLHGLRLSEALALRWDQVDTTRGSIRVQGASVRGSKGGIRVDKATNKNASSTRTVPIMIPQLLEALKAEEDRSDRVVTITGSVLLRDVQRTCERAGVTVVTCHGLRHSFASLCYRLGVNERQLMQWGGWSDYTTMHKIYVRLAQSAESEAQAKVTAFFQNANGKC